MCSDFVIQVKNLSKCYQIYDQPSDRLKQFLYSGFSRIIRKNPKPLFRKFWALREVFFEIERGESVGIIGRNGSGKSTLLQLICGTLSPTCGVIKTHGRIAALLELGSGFNPEFSGRENVYMNAALLGLTRIQVDRCFDEILEFSGLGEFIDQPTKTYSSGMFIRLAFAVQVCIEPDVLIIDEAIAVGDELFQKRCFERMNQLRTNGVTLLLVSHDQEILRTMTEKGIFLEDGAVKFTGTSAEALFEYRKSLHEIEARKLRMETFSIREKLNKKENYQNYKVENSRKDTTKLSSINNLVMFRKNASPSKLSRRSKDSSFGDLDAEVLNISILNEEGESCSHFDPRDVIIIIVQCQAHVELTHLNVGLRIRNKEGVKIYSWGTLNQDMAILHGAPISDDIFWYRNFSKNEIFSIRFRFICGMGPNFYEVQTSITEERKPYYAAQRMIHWIDEAAFFVVTTEQQSYHFGGVADLRMTSNFLEHSD